MKKRLAVLGISAVMMTGLISGLTAGAAEVSYEEQSIGLEGVANARQLGGYISADGKKVKENLLLRTGKLTDATQADLAKLTDTYHVTKIIDFRTSFEKEEAPDPEVAGAENLWISILEEEGDTSNLAATVSSSADPVQMLIDYAKSGKVETMYTDIVVNEHSQAGYTQFFDELLNQEDGAILWHCTGGKDRAGLATVLLLSALGVEEDTIMADFELSNVAYQDNIAYMVQMAEEKGCTEDEVAGVKNLSGVNAEYMQNALDLIDDEYGSMQEYLNNQLDVSEEDIAALQAKYLEN